MPAGKYERRIGGTDISLIVGQSPYGGPIDSYRRIVEGYRQEQNPAMRRGILLEPVCRQMYVEDTGAKLRTPEPGFFASPHYPFMAASLDDIAVRDGAELVVEYKTANIRMLDKWGEAGTDQVPTEYLLQCAWYMAAMSLPLADLAVLLAGDEFRVYRITRDLELESMLLEAAERFWVDHVLKKVPPPPDASPAYSEWLAQRYPKDTGVMLSASAEDMALVAKFRQAREAKEAAEALEAEARNALLLTIGAASGMEGPGFRLTYKSTKGRETTDWSAVAMEAEIAPALIARHTKRTGYRVFRPTFHKESSK